MNDERSFERFVADNLAGMGGTPMPDEFFDDIDTYTSHHKQPPRWLALIKEPPMRTESRLAVGSPTVRAMAILAATLLLAVAMAAAGVAGSRLLAADGPIIVDQSGNGTVKTITEAVAMAEDGDEILVKPGTYTESVAVDKDITIAGDGPPDEVVVRIADDGPTDVMIFGESPRYAFYLDEANATVGNLTVAGPSNNVSAFVVVGGNPTIHDVVANLEPKAFRGVAGFVFMDGATGAIRGNTTNLFLWVDGGSTPEIAGNVSTNVIRTNGVGTDPWIHGNVATGVWAHDGSAPLVEDNDISGSASPDCGIEAAGDDARPIVRDNRLSENGVGICATDGGSIAELTGNTVTGNGTGLRVESSSEVPDLAGNTICDNDLNVVVGFGEGAPSDEELCAGVVPQ